jgi:hypothetical protein
MGRDALIKKIGQLKHTIGIKERSPWASEKGIRQCYAILRKYEKELDKLA